MDPARAGTRPYHHGDLQRGLVDAARRILEGEGPSALSLRAVAREAGVSPAAPYHHFKDKAELLDAVAHQGWAELNTLMSSAKAAAEPHRQLTALGMAYVGFARDNPALYRVMYDAARNKEALPVSTEAGGDSPYCKVRQTMVEAAGEAQPRDLELATIAAWCSAHGLAEMAGFRQFDRLKAELGGETAFIQSVLSHMRLFPRRPGD